MPRENEIEQLKQQLQDLQAIIQGSERAYHIPDPIKQLSEYSGNKKELNAWLQEIDELYEEFKIKGQRGAPDTFNAHYLRAIKNKLKGEARTVVCANGNPETFEKLKEILRENFGDQRDFTTNLNQLFHLRKGERSNHKYYSEIKELNTRLKANLQMHPLNSAQLLEIITVTKFLDGINEPLASIIRNSKPSTLEDAYQAVIINQNAEVRKPVYKPKPPFGQNTSAQNSERKVKSYDTRPNYKPKTFQPRPKVETNNTEENDIRQEEDPEVSDTYDSEVEIDDLNFHRAEEQGPLTWISSHI